MMQSIMKKMGKNNQDGPDYNYSWNCGAEGPSRKKAIVELRKKQIRNAMMLLLLSQGTPCLLAGDEFGNTRRGTIMYIVRIMRQHG